MSQRRERTSLAPLLAFAWEVYLKPSCVQTLFPRCGEKRKCPLLSVVVERNTATHSWVRSVTVMSEMGAPEGSRTTPSTSLSRLEFFNDDEFSNCPRRSDEECAYKRDGCRPMHGTSIRYQFPPGKERGKDRKA